MWFPCKSWISLKKVSETTTCFRFLNESSLLVLLRSCFLWFVPHFRLDTKELWTLQSLPFCLTSKCLGMGEVCRIGNSKIQYSCQSFAWANCTSSVRTTHMMSRAWLLCVEIKTEAKQFPGAIHTFLISKALFFFLKKKLYWCKGLGPVNLEQTSKMVIKTTTEIRTDESKSSRCLRKLLQKKFIRLQ